jgi:hypothetical protein
VNTPAKTKTFERTESARCRRLNENNYPIWRAPGVLPPKTTFMASGSLGLASFRHFANAHEYFHRRTDDGAALRERGTRQLPGLENCATKCLASCRGGHGRIGSREIFSRDASSRLRLLPLPREYFWEESHVRDRLARQFAFYKIGAGDR